MAGLLDALGNMTPDQQQGLLAAAAQMMQQSGPSVRPISLGQILGGGMTAYQDSTNLARKRQMEEDAAKQSGLLRGLQIQEAQGGLEDHALDRDQRERLRQFYVKDQTGTSAPTSPTDVGPTAMPPMASAMPGGMNSPKIGGPDWMQSFQASQPAQQAPTPTPAPQAQVSDADPFARRMALAQRLRSAGFYDQAAAQEDAARKDKPKFANEPRVVMGPDGKPILVQMADDGTVRPIQGGYGVADKLNFQSTGGNTYGLDSYSGDIKKTIRNTQSPDSMAADARALADRNAGGEDAVMDPLAVRMTAQQYLAGDAGALQNFGRGSQGAKNLNAVRLEVSKQANATGMSGADVAAKMAEFAGLKAGQRTAGTRSANIEIAANEVAQLAPIALDASAKVARSGFLPFGKAQIMFDSNSNDPNMRQFAMANTALVNAYGQAMARGGSATVSDKDHARELLSTAFDQKSYAAAVAQLQTETRAAQAAPKQVRKDLSDAASGREAAAKPATAAKTFDVLPPASQFDGKRMASENGTVYKSVNGQWVKE